MLGVELICQTLCVVGARSSVVSEDDMLCIPCPFSRLGGMDAFCNLVSKQELLHPHATTLIISIVEHMSPI